MFLWFNKIEGKYTDIAEALQEKFTANVTLRDAELRALPLQHEHDKDADFYDFHLAPFWEL